MSQDAPPPPNRNLPTRVDYLRRTLEIVTVEEWDKCVRTYLALAQAGDHKALRWVTEQVGMAHANQLHITLEAQARPVVANLRETQRTLLGRLTLAAMGSDDPRAIGGALQAMREAGEDGAKPVTRPVFATAATLPLLQPKKDTADG